jgi:DNA-binding Lrp family transcriptional regulator
MSQQTRLDITDLRIMKLLSRNSRTPYRNIASAVGIMPSAVKERINKMVSNGAIRSFVLLYIQYYQPRSPTKQQDLLRHANYFFT